MTQRNRSLKVQKKRPKERVKAGQELFGRIVCPNCLPTFSLTRGSRAVSGFFLPDGPVIRFRHHQ